MEFCVSRRDFALNPVRNSISIKSMIDKGQISNGVKFLSVAFMPRQSSRTDCVQRPENERLVHHRIFYVMYHDWIGNFKPNAYKPDSFGYGLSKYYRVDGAKRAAYQRKYK